MALFVLELHAMLVQVATMQALGFEIDFTWMPNG
jgi:hypothetical protein